MSTRLSLAIALAAAVCSTVTAPAAVAQPAVGPGVCVSSPEICKRGSGGGGSGGGRDFVPTVDPAQAAADEGNRALDAGDLQGASAAFARALQINPNHGYAWNGLGIVYTRQNNIQGALAAFNRAAALGVPNARENYDKILKHQKDVDAWQQKNRDVAQQNVDRGKLLLRQGKYLEARAFFRTALNHDPNNADARAAEPYIAALERAGPPPRPDPRTVAQKEAFARARTGDPAWVREVTDKVARKLNDRSIGAGGMAWAEALLADHAVNDAGMRTSDDLSAHLANAFWASSRKKAGVAVEISLPGLAGIQTGQPPPPATGESPTPVAELPAVKKAELGKPLDGKDLASLEAAHAAAARAVVRQASPEQKAAAQQRTRSVEIEMVVSSPDAPRPHRFIEPPPPVVTK